MQLSDQNKKGTGRWSTQEHQRFMLGIMQYGKDWKKVEQVVQTRSGTQVRSHAQKFFSKLRKGQPQGRNPSENDNNRENEISQTENEWVKSYNQESQYTPMEIVSLIRKESQPNKKINLHDFKKTLEFQGNLDHQKTIIEEDQIDQIDHLKKLSSFKSMSNILSAYENLNENKIEQQPLEDQSFLLLLTKKYKKYFTKGMSFQSLIDFPKEIPQASKELNKKSFTLPDGVTGDQKEVRREMKRRMSIKLQSFKQEMSDKKIPLAEQHNYLSSFQAISGCSLEHI